MCQVLKILNSSHPKEAAEDSKMTLNKFISGRKTDNAMAKERKMKKKKTRQTCLQNSIQIIEDWAIRTPPKYWF